MSFWLAALVFYAVPAMTVGAFVYHEVIRERLRDRSLARGELVTGLLATFSPGFNLSVATVLVIWAIEFLYHGSVRAFGLDKPVFKNKGPGC